MNIEMVIASATLGSGIYSLACAHKATGMKLAGFYKDEGNHALKQAQLAITGVLVSGFAIWWIFNPGILFK